EKASPVGTLFYLYLILAGLERFFIEFIRTNNEYVFGLTGAQLISLVMISIGTYLLVKTRQVSIPEPVTDTNP
ncbi:MAG: prolipoprotein diacylglyceryl transferase, partial [Candidatus Marinimicrobia bacterium]|nr:prolipoprotein diacylglyceryl transferase [Candidatus Neomarinimicrobiota bacterium]